VMLRIDIYLACAEARAAVLLIIYVIFLFLSWSRLHLFVILAVTLIFVIGCRKVASGGHCPPIKAQNGKVVIITGANTGIGKDTAIALAERGAKVIIACRDNKRGLDAAADIRKAARLAIGSKQVELMLLDLSDLDSVRRFVDDFRAKQLPLHILINNAGIMDPPYGLTKRGHESQFGTNHLGHFLLTTLLLDEIKEYKARVVTVSSLAHFALIRNKVINSVEQLNVIDKTKYVGEESYGYSKLANLLFTRELERRLEGSGAHAYSLHPGSVVTELARNVPIFGTLVQSRIGRRALGLLLKYPEEGAQTSLYCATQNAVPGEYHVDCKLAPCSNFASDLKLASELWAYSERLVL